MNDAPMDTVRAIAAQTPGAHWVATEDGHGHIVDLPWVPYGPGFEIPMIFEYEGDEHGPFLWKLTALVIEGRPQVVRLECWTFDPSRTVTPEALHRFPLGRLLEEATLMASRPSDEVPHRFVRWENVDAVRAARAAVAMQIRKRPDNRRVLTDELLAEVAEVYRQHVPTGKPSKAVAERFNYTDASARRVVREARLRGLLGPARPGRGGEETTREDIDA